MNRLFKTLLTLTLLLGTSARAELGSGLGVMGFQAWKSSRIDEAKAQLEKLQAEPGASARTEVKALKGPQDAGRLLKVRADQRLQQAQLSLEIVKELSVNDYFVLYLNQFKDRTSFLEAARKLTSEETADLMIAYQKHLSQGSENETSLPVRGSARN